MNTNWQESIDRKPLPYHLAALFLVLMIASIVYFDTFRSMVETWLRSDTFLHGFIILPISVYLVWQKWPQLRTIPLRPMFLGAWLLLGISTAWFFADVLGIQVGKQFAATAIIPAAVLTVMGRPFARSIAFPLGYLIFAVPFGEFWVPELMEITADFAIGLLRITGIPVYRDGLFLSIPVGNFEVAEACSGIRYILATLALGTLYAYLHYQKMYKRWIFIAFSLVLPIIANGVRAYGIITIAYYSDMKHAVGVDHIIYGWLFFGVVIALMFLVGNRFSDDGPWDQESVSVDVADAGPTKLSWLVFVALAASVVTLFGPLASHAVASKNTQESDLQNGLPNDVAAWRGTVLLSPDWAPSFIGATQDLLVRYLRDEMQVDVALIRYSGYRQGNEIANNSNSIFGANGWKRRNTRPLNIELANGRSVQILETLAVRHGSVRRFWYWYEVDGIIAAGSAKIKVNEALSLLRGGSAISSVIIVSTADDGSRHDVLLEFLRDANDDIGACMIAVERRSECSLGLHPGAPGTDPEQAL